MYQVNVPSQLTWYETVMGVEHSKYPLSFIFPSLKNQTMSNIIEQCKIPYVQVPSVYIQAYLKLPLQRQVYCRLVCKVEKDFERVIIKKQVIPHSLPCGMSELQVLYYASCLLNVRLFVLPTYAGDELLMSKQTSDSLLFADIQNYRKSNIDVDMQKLLVGDVTQNLKYKPITTLLKGPSHIGKTTILAEYLYDQQCKLLKNVPVSRGNYTIEDNNKYWDNVIGKQVLDIDDPCQNQRSSLAPIINLCNDAEFKPPCAELSNKGTPIKPNFVNITVNAQNLEKGVASKTALYNRIDMFVDVSLKRAYQFEDKEKLDCTKILYLCSKCQISSTSHQCSCGLLCEHVDIDSMYNVTINNVQHKYRHVYNLLLSKYNQRINQLYLKHYKCITNNILSLLKISPLKLNIIKKSRKEIINEQENIASEFTGLSPEIPLNQLVDEGSRTSTYNFNNFSANIFDIKERMKRFCEDEHFDEDELITDFSSFMPAVTIEDCNAEQQRLDNERDINAARKRTTANSPSLLSHKPPICLQEYIKICEDEGENVEIMLTRVGVDRDGKSCTHVHGNQRCVEYEKPFDEFDHTTFKQKPTYRNTRNGKTFNDKTYFFDGLEKKVIYNVNDSFNSKSQREVGPTEKFSYITFYSDFEDMYLDEHDCENRLLQHHCRKRLCYPSMKWLFGKERLNYSDYTPINRVSYFVPSGQEHYTGLYLCGKEYQIPFCSKLEYTLERVYADLSSELIVEFDSWGGIHRQSRWNVIPSIFSPCYWGESDAEDVYHDCEGEMIHVPYVKRFATVSDSSFLYRELSDTITPIEWIKKSSKVTSKMNGRVYSKDQVEEINNVHKIIHSNKPFEQKINAINEHLEVLMLKREEPTQENLQAFHDRKNGVRNIIEGKSQTVTSHNAYGRSEVFFHEKHTKTLPSNIEYINKRTLFRKLIEHFSNEKLQYTLANHLMCSQGFRTIQSTLTILYYFYEYIQEERLRSLIESYITDEFTINFTPACLVERLICDILHQLFSYLEKEYIAFSVDCFYLIFSHFKYGINIINPLIGKILSVFLPKCVKRYQGFLQLIVQFLIEGSFDPLTYVKVLAEVSEVNPLFRSSLHLAILVLNFTLQTPMSRSLFFIRFTYSAISLTYDCIRKFLY